MRPDRDRSYSSFKSRSLCVPFATVNGIQVEGIAARQKVRRKEQGQHKGQAVGVDDESVTVDASIERSLLS